MDNFDPYYVFLAIATNIPVLLMTVSISYSKSQFAKPAAKMLLV